MFLVLGFFTCGFQLAFITLHLPSYLIDRGLSAQVGGWALATIGLFNIIGSISVGWLSMHYPRRYLLAFNYFLRAVFIAAFVLLPASPVTTLLFGAGMGLMWLSTVPPTSALVTLMFGTRWLATLYGFAFFSHQVGGFLGAWLGGLLYERTGSYDIVWWLAVAVRRIVGGDQPADRGKARAAGSTRRRVSLAAGAARGTREWRRPHRHRRSAGARRR